MPFVQSEGSLTSLFPNGGNGWWTRLNLDSVPSHLRAQGYGWIYRKQPNIRKCVSFLANNIAQLSLPLYKRIGEDSRKKMGTHPMAMLLRQPDPYTTPFRFMRALVSDLAIYDVAYVLKYRPTKGGEIQALKRLPADRVELKGGSWISPDKFILHGDTGTKEFNADEVIFFRGYHPDSDNLGSSPIDALRDDLINESEAVGYQQQLWRSGARFNGYIKQHIDSRGFKDDAALARFRAAWRSQYSGSGAEVGGTPILEPGMEFLSAGITPEEALYIEGRKLTREECASAYHIPLPMVGILEHATYSNITEMHKMLYQDTLGPWLEMIQQEFMLQLLPDLESKPDKFYLEFDIGDKIEGNFMDQVDSLLRACGGPFMLRSEARARLNMPEQEGFDEPITPKNVAEGGQSDPLDGGNPVDSGDETPPQTGPNDPVKAALQTFFARQGRSVVSQVGAGRAGFDFKRWNRELADVLREQGFPAPEDVAETLNAEVASQLTEDVGETKALYARLTEGSVYA